MLARKESTSVFPTSVQVFKADYDNRAELERAMTGQDVVISMVNGLAASGQNILVDAAIAAGVKRFFPSEFGPPSQDPKFRSMNSEVLGPKAALVDYIKTKESQISWTSIVTGSFFDWALLNGFFGFDIASQTANLIDDGTSVGSGSTLSYIAQAVLACFKHADETKNQYVVIGEVHVSQREVLETFEKLQGAKWIVKNQTSEELIANGKKMKEAGNPWYITEFTRAGALGKTGLGDNRPWGLWNEKLGLKGSSLEPILKDVLIRAQDPNVEKIKF